MGVVIEQSGSSPYLGARCENIFIHNIDPGTIKNLITYFGSQQRSANEIFIIGWGRYDEMIMIKRYVAMAIVMFS